MAYLDDTDEQKKRVAPGQPGLLSAPSAQSAGGALAAGKPTQSGSFVNLQKYVTANKGNDTSMGNALQNTIQNKATAADTTINDWKKGASDTVAANTYTNENQDISDVATGNTGGYKGAEKDASDFSGYDAAKNAAQGVEDYSNTITNNGGAGIQVGLKDTFGANGQRYANGQASLDSTILGQGTGGQAALKGIKEKFGSYSGKYSDAAASVKGAVDAARARDHKEEAATHRANTTIKPIIPDNFDFGEMKLGPIGVNYGGLDFSRVGGVGGAASTGGVNATPTGLWPRLTPKKEEEDSTEYRTNGPW